MLITAQQNRPHLHALHQPWTSLISAVMAPPGRGARGRRARARRSAAQLWHAPAARRAHHAGHAQPTHSLQACTDACCKLLPAQAACCRGLGSGQQHTATPLLIRLALVSRHTAIDLLALPLTGLSSLPQTHPPRWTMPLLLPRHVRVQLPTEAVLALRVHRAPLVSHSSQQLSLSALVHT